MKGKSYLCLQPMYMNEFQCDGSVCQSECCRGNWMIEIDVNTYNRYCGINSVEERNKIISYIRPRELGHKKTYELLRNENGACPFLRGDYLCGLQKRYGEEFLSQACVTYPRIINIMDDMMERGLVLSCPVAAGLILLKKEPMEFEQRDVLKRHLNSSTLWDMGRFPLGKYLIELQFGCISVLQNRRLTLDQRLILMGFFLEQAEELSESKQAGMLRELVESYTSDFVAEGVTEFVGAISLQVTEYLRCMIGMVEVLYGKGSCARRDEDQKFLDALASLYHFSEGQETASIRNLQKRYGAYRASAKLIMQKYSYIFENWLVNEFFVNMYPFWIRGSLIENYLYFLMSYKLVEFLTIALVVAKKDEPEEAMLVDSLCYFSKKLDHGPIYMKFILEEIRKYNKDMSFFMRTLLDGSSYEGEYICQKTVNLPL